MSREFFRAGPFLYRVSAVRSADISKLSTEGRVSVYMDDWVDLSGMDAVEFLMNVHPGALEGSGVRWLRRSWMLHNLFGHPAMEILCRLGFTRLGLKIHDDTVPPTSKIRRRA